VLKKVIINHFSTEMYEKAKKLHLIEMRTNHL